VRSGYGDSNLGHLEGREGSLIGPGVRCGRDAPHTRRNRGTLRAQTRLTFSVKKQSAASARGAGGGARTLRRVPVGPPRVNPKVVRDPLHLRSLSSDLVEDRHGARDLQNSALLGGMQTQKPHDVRRIAVEANVRGRAIEPHHGVGPVLAGFSSLSEQVVRGVLGSPGCQDAGPGPRRRSKNLLRPSDPREGLSAARRQSLAQREPPGADGLRQRGR